MPRQHAGTDAGPPEGTDLRPDGRADDADPHPQARAALPLLRLDARAADTVPARLPDPPHPSRRDRGRRHRPDPGARAVPGDHRRDLARGEADDQGLTERQVRDDLHRFDELWSELFPAEQARIVQLLVERVDVCPTGVDITLRTDGLTSVLQDLRAADARTKDAA